MYYHKFKLCLVNPYKHWFIQMTGNLIVATKEAEGMSVFLK